MSLEDYCKKDSGFSLILLEIKNIIFSKITKNSLQLFLRGKDIISVSPQTCGFHEPGLTNLISSIAKNGASDFLIDIGANIGLTSCQNGNDFKYVFCFEPNPLSCQILRVNAEISLDMSKVQIYEFGLGEADETLKLMIPRHNWGGAFVVSSSNSYSDDLLAFKDGFYEIQSENYITKEVKIKSTKGVLHEVFSSIGTGTDKSGMIKIDVEGMEPTVLKGIAASLPLNVKTTIVFENWDKDFDFVKLTEYFSNRSIKILKLEEKNSYKKSWPRFIKGVLLLFGKRTLRIVDIADCSDKIGDIIIDVK